MFGSVCICLSIANSNQILLNFGQFCPLSFYHVCLKLSSLNPHDWSELGSNQEGGSHRTPKVDFNSTCARNHLLWMLQSGYTESKGYGSVASPGRWKEFIRYLLALSLWLNPRAKRGQVSSITGPRHLDHLNI